jgi:uncharacterized membrane-anchored protein YhcB (DUF1043 family)
MNTNWRIFVLAVGLLSAVVTGVVASELKASEARRQIARALGFSKTNQIHIKDISVTGGEAIVEAQFDAAFRFSTDKSGEWKPVEIRTGDRQWESLELIETAIRKEKELRTSAELRTLATALDAYRRERGGYVTASSGAGLMDQLAPRYVKVVIRIDAWSNEFDYSGTSSGYRLSSRGPDGKSGTGDDLIIENGQAVRGVVE